MNEVDVVSLSCRVAAADDVTAQVEAAPEAAVDETGPEETAEPAEEPAPTEEKQ